MSISLPSAGTAVLATWGDDVATLLNRMIVLSMTADVVSNSSSFAGFGNITGLTFACVAGTNYTINLTGAYTVNNTSTGLGIGYTHPGGTARILVEVASASVTTIAREWLTAVDTATGTSTTDTTNAHWFSYRGIYQCTTSGTFAMRANRNGTTSNVTILKGSGGLVIASA